VKFQIVHADGGQVFIRLRAGNNEITLSGETQSNTSDALSTIMNIKEGAADAVVEEVNGRTRTVLWTAEGGGLDQFAGGLI
jgi:uncharacterized protein YegP (UPF0339 family)